MKFFTLSSEIKGMTIPLQVIKATHLEIQHHDLIGLATEEK